MICKRCGKEYADGFGYRFFCYDCQREFDGLIEELKAGFIADWDEKKHTKSGVKGK